MFSKILSPKVQVILDATPLFHGPQSLHFNDFIFHDYADRWTHVIIHCDIVVSRSVL